MKKLALPDFPGWLCIVLTAVIWSTSGLLTRVMAAPATVVLTVRFASAAVCMAPFIHKEDIQWNWRFVNLIAAYILNNITYIGSYALTNAATAIALHYTAPLFIYLWNLRKTRRTNWRQVVPMVLIAFGTLICFFEAADRTHLLGNLIALVSGVCFAWLNLAIAGLGRKNSLGNLSICNFIAVPFMLLMIPGNAFAQLAALEPWQWLLGIAFGSLQVSLSYAFYFKGLLTTPLQKASIITLLEVLLSPTWTLLLLGDRPSIYGLICWICILSGLLVEGLLKPKWDAPEKTAVQE